MHLSPLHRFQNLSMLPFLATAVRSMVCDCVTHRKPISVRMLICPLSRLPLFEIASFAKMATCSYSELVSGSCSSRKTSGESKCIVITKCKRDIQGHLKTYKCPYAQLESESILLLARAGKYLIIKNFKNV